MSLFSISLIKGGTGEKPVTRKGLSKLEHVRLITVHEIERFLIFVKNTGPILRGNVAFS